MYFKVLILLATALLGINILHHTRLSRRKGFLESQARLRARLVSPQQDAQQAEQEIAASIEDFRQMAKRATLLRSASAVALVLVFAFAIGYLNERAEGKAAPAEQDGNMDHAQHERTEVRKTAESVMERELFMAPIRRIVERAYRRNDPQTVTDAKLLMLLYNTTTHPEDADVNYKVKEVFDVLSLAKDGRGVAATTQYVLEAARDWKEDPEAGWFKAKIAIGTKGQSAEELRASTSVKCRLGEHSAWSPVPGEHWKIVPFRTERPETNDHWVKVNLPAGIKALGIANWDGRARLEVGVNATVERQPSLYFFECQRFMGGLQALHATIQTTLADSNAVSPRVCLGYPFVGDAARYDVRALWNADRLAVDYLIDVRMSPGMGQNAIAFNFLPGSTLLGSE